MFSKDIGIDLGTTNILIYVKGQGIVLNEPSVIVIDQEKNIQAIGTKAYQMIGKTPPNLKIVKPLKDGVIADFELTSHMLEQFIEQIHVRGMFNKPRMLICCPTNTTKVERKALEETLMSLGARTGIIELEPKVAAIGSGLSIDDPLGNMIVDIGGGTTDIAVLSLGNIVVSSSIKIAGNTFDEDIRNYIREKYRILIGEKTVETAKMKIGAIEPKEIKKLEIRGRNLLTGLPTTFKLTNQDISEAIHGSIDTIIKTIRSVLEITPPELSGDIYDRGITITGGGALIQNLADVFQEKLKLIVHTSSNPLTSVVEGTGYLLDNLSKQKR